MRTAVLGASGKVGRLLVAQAIERGHHVVALVRAPDRYADAAAGVEVRRADVLHAPDLAGGPVSASRRIVPLADLKRPLLPPRISRASLASLLLDEAETGRHAGGIVVPLR